MLSLDNARQYTAFISYRHCPLDIRVAETLHRMIERYRIPRDLRKEGEKSLGLVFRDRDELPLSNNLNQDIYDALDNSRFLIVICTPDTPKSQWVAREIDYFISKHGRDRILTVLAAGTPEESIPRRIICDYAEDGSVSAEYEPLCAYLSDSSERKVLKNLKSEFLRLLAAIMDCPYDALRQRQKRYRIQQITALMGVVTAVALIFIVMLGNRNQEIQKKNEEIAAQLLQTQINETNALVLLSHQQLADGDRIGAIESALNALPHDNDGRPYSADAEFALERSLNPYGNGMPVFGLTIEQPMDIYEMTVSDDGKHLVTIDYLGCIRCFDVVTARMLWEYQLVDPDEPIYDASLKMILLDISEEQNLVVYSDGINSYLLSLASGEVIHQLPFLDPDLSNDAVLSPDGKWLVQSSRPQYRQLGMECSCADSYHIIPFYDIYSVETGESVQWIWCNLEKEWYLDDPVFNADGTKLAFVMYNFQDPQLWVTVYDVENWEFQYEYFVDPELEDNLLSSQIELLWYPNGELLLYYAEQDPDTYDYYLASIHKFDTAGNEIVSRQYRIDHRYASAYSIVDAIIDENHVYTYDFVFLIHPNSVLVFNLETCELYRAHAFPGNDILRAYRSNTDRITLIFSDGTVKDLDGTDESAGDTVFPAFDEDLELTDGHAAKVEIIEETSVMAELEATNDVEIICAVPTGAPNTVRVIQSDHGANTFFIPASIGTIRYDSLESCVIHSFPDAGFYLTLICCSDENNEPLYTAALLDEHTGAILDQFQLPRKCEFRGLSPDQNKIMFDSCMYDLDSHTLSDGPLEEAFPEEGVNYELELQAAITKESSVFTDGILNSSSGTLYWWAEDQRIHQTELPYDETYEVYAPSSLEANGRAEVGGNGLIVVQIRKEDSSLGLYDGSDEYFIYSTTDDLYHRLPRQTIVPGPSAFAIGSTHKAVAFADYDRVLRIYDFDRDAVIKQYPLPVSPESILKMFYHSDDRYLLLFVDWGNTTKLTIMDTQDGSVVKELTLPEHYYLSSFDESFMQIDPQNNLLIIHSLFMYGTVIDTTSWSVIAQIPGLEYYLPGSNMIIQDNYGFPIDISTRFSMPLSTYLYSLEKMTEMGWDLLNTVKENQPSKTAEN